MSADYDLKSNQKTTIHITHASLDADANGVTVDTKDYGSLTFGIYVGIGGITFTTTNKVEFTMQESNDDSTWNVCADDAMVLDPNTTAPGGTGIFRSLIAAKASADTTMTTVGYRGKKRYARVRAEFGGTHSSATPMMAVAIQGHPRVRPVGAYET